MILLNLIIIIQVKKRVIKRVKIVVKQKVKRIIIKTKKNY